MHIVTSIYCVIKKVFGSIWAVCPARVKIKMRKERIDGKKISLFGATIYERSLSIRHISLRFLCLC